MPRLLSSYAANKRVEDGLKKKQEQIRLDYIKATHRHLDETEKLVDDLIHINVRTPSAFELAHHRPSSGSDTGRHVTSNHSKPTSNIQFQPAINGSQQTLDSLKDSNASEKYGLSSGVSPASFRTELAMCKAPGHPTIQVRNNEVFYQYQTQARSWKKVEPNYKTKLLLHRNNTVIQALKNFNARPDELSESPSSDDLTNTSNSVYSNTAKRKSSVFMDESVFGRRGSLFPRRLSRRDSRISMLTGEDDRRKLSTVQELPQPITPGRTPRSLDGWTIMKWCLWNKQEKTPVWATKKYADMKHKEYQQFITNMNEIRKNSEQADPSMDKIISSKPKSANAANRKDQNQLHEELRVVGERRPSLPRAKSVPVNKMSFGTVSESGEEGDDKHFPSIDRGAIRPTTSILRTASHASDFENNAIDNDEYSDKNCNEDQNKKAKTESQGEHEVTHGNKSASRRKRRVALDICPVEDMHQVFGRSESVERESGAHSDTYSQHNRLRPNFSAGSSISTLKSGGKHVSYFDEENIASTTHSVLTWGALTEVDNELSSEEELN